MNTIEQMLNDEVRKSYTQDEVKSIIKDQTDALLTMLNENIGGHDHLKDVAPYIDKAANCVDSYLKSFWVMCGLQKFIDLHNAFLLENVKWIKDRLLKTNQLINDLKNKKQ